MDSTGVEVITMTQREKGNLIFLKESIVGESVSELRERFESEYSQKIERVKLVKLKLTADFIFENKVQNSSGKLLPIIGSKPSFYSLI